MSENICVVSPSKSVKDCFLVCLVPDNVFYCDGGFYSVVYIDEFRRYRCWYFDGMKSVIFPDPKTTVVTPTNIKITLEEI